ncbi:Uncharacterized protein DBV15_07209 [Temnothorax longispinosus]|uniref:Uncharacterized protein n=1 Tax=Temnothorax longispinosus TaxID=300112 RepID=A0A4V3S678_9HYME|nr:Uncharacterized protein DBV15_07209 [Temnothorax longispinosus]
MLSSRKQRNAHYVADERAPVIGDEPRNGGNRMVKRGHGTREIERTGNERGENRKTKPFRRRLGNGSFTTEGIATRRMIGFGANTSSDIVACFMADEARNGKRACNVIRVRESLNRKRKRSTLQTWFSAPLPRLEPVSYYVCCSTERSKGIGNIWRYLSFDRNVNSKKVEDPVLKRMYARMTFRRLCNKD